MSGLAARTPAEFCPHCGLTDDGGTCGDTISAVYALLSGGFVERSNSIRSRNGPSWLKPSFKTHGLPRGCSSRARFLPSRRRSRSRSAWAPLWGDIKLRGGVMRNFRVVNATLILPDREIPGGAIDVDNGRIRALGPQQELGAWSGSTVDAAGGYVTPGFVDLHVHGGDNADFMDGTVEAFERVARAHTRHGTTSIVPTSTVARHEQTIAFLQNTQVAAPPRRPAAARPLPCRRRAPLWTVLQRREGRMPSKGSGTSAQSQSSTSNTSNSPMCC